MTQARFKAAIADARAAAEKAAGVEELCRVYLRESSRPPPKE